MFTILLLLLSTFSLQAKPLCGADQLEELATYVSHSEPLGILTNQTGRTSDGRRTIDALVQAGFNVKKIFAPEHGLNGTVLAEHKVDNHLDETTKLPVLSLYAGNGPGGIAAALEGISTILVDLQDAGMRHYTYISMMYKALEFAAANKKKVIVLDRPNPLGAVLEGPLVDPSLISFISIAPIPIRHGMTMGELALYFNQTQLKEPAQLQVLAMRDYHRHQTHIVLPLSPNLRFGQSINGYSFMGMLGEISPFHVAVGTPKAFRCIMLPKSLKIPQKKWIALSLGLAQFGIMSTAYSYYNEQKKQEYTGLMTTIADVEQVSAINALVYVVDFFKKEGIAYSFAPNFDKAFGTLGLRQYLQNSIERSEFVAVLNKQAQQFYDAAHEFWLYKPGPKLVLLR